MTRAVLRWLGIATVSLLGIAFFQCPVRADSDRVEDARKLAQQLEKERDWPKACAQWAYLLSITKDSVKVEDRKSFQTCLRHLHRVRRHQDASYRQVVLEQDVPVALKVYGEVLGQLRSEYAEEDRADLNRLFRHGIYEFSLALGDEGFCKLYLPDAKRADIDSFLTKIRDQWNGKHVRQASDAQTQALRIAFAANKALGIKPTVTVLEFACGACNALDEHTYYMTPRQFVEDLTSLRGDAIGVGIDLESRGRRLIVNQVVINSPAARAGLRGDEEVLRIDRVPAEKLTVEAALEKLKGKLGTTVELEVLIEGRTTRTFTLVRQPVNMSVTFYRMLVPEQGIGYIQLVTFNENTMQELDEAIRTLDMQGMKVLILDLRGNGGGLFDAAVQVAERFLWEGAYIVSTRGKVRDVKRVSRNPSPLGIPVVVLVDQGTASAAEIVAGALKENFVGTTMQPRATLVGMPTFGKGTVQHMVELKTVQAGGIRITWAKFFSPRNNPYNGIGVEPHLKIPGADAQLGEAVRVAGELTRPMISSMMH